MPAIDWSAMGTAAGGLGLLLLGMGLLTDGLKKAAGQALNHMLARWTRTRLRGFAAGALITAVVQSSSAVTVAIIGFTNAGLLSPLQSAGVVFGSNVGTTMTSWLVAVVGLKIKVEAFALPILGLGMLVRLIRPQTRVGNIGEALAGFGALFFGLDLLKETFSQLGQTIDLGVIEGWGFPGQLAGVGLGVLITVLMQSSSAAMAMILTALSQNLLSPPFAAALVIGTNVGTTSTALLSTLGATPNARRVASLHIAFNLITAVIALMLLAPILQGIGELHGVFGTRGTPEIDLALFHTTFNVLGVALIWPIAPGLVRWLEGRFRSAEEDAARPRHLDGNILQIPELAARALLLELRRAGSMAYGLAREALNDGLDDPERFADRARPLRRLLVSIADYATRLNRAGLSSEVAGSLTSLLRAHEHLWTIVHVAADLVGLRAESYELASADRPPLSSEYMASAHALLDALDKSAASFDLHACHEARDAHETARRREHQRLFNLGLSGQSFLPATHQSLQELALDRRLLNRAWKLGASLHVVEKGLGAAKASESAKSRVEAAGLEGG